MQTQSLVLQSRLKMGGVWYKRGDITEFNDKDASDYLAMRMARNPTPAELARHKAGKFNEPVVKAAVAKAMGVSSPKPASDTPPAGMPATTPETPPAPPPGEPVAPVQAPAQGNPGDKPAEPVGEPQDPAKVPGQRADEERARAKLHAQGGKRR